jgi:hypothetical protein
VIEVPAAMCPCLPIVLALIVAQGPVPKKGIIPPPVPPFPPGAGPALAPKPTGPPPAPAPPTGPTLIALDFKARPVAEVVRGLGERSGGQVEAFGMNDPSGGDKSITLEAPAPVPFWDAVDRFTAATKLQRTMTWTGPFGNPRPRVQFHTPMGSGDYGPADYVGPFRLGAVSVHEHFDRVFLRPKSPPNVAGDPVPTFYAEIPLQAEPNLIYLRTGPLRRLEAVDELGQSYLDPKLGGEGPASGTIPEYQGAKGVRVPLIRPGRTAKALATLSGLIPLEVARRPPTPTRVVPLEGTSGQTFREGDVSITVREYKVNDQGQTVVKLTARIEGKRGEVDPRLKGLVDARLWAIFYHGLELVDSQGKPVSLAGGGGPSGNRELNMDYTHSPYPIGAKGFPPVQLRIYRPDWVAWDLPFSFKDVPLP